MKKHIITFIFLFLFSISHSQTVAVDSLRGEFTYVLQYKPEALHRHQVIKELFSLQISDTRAFFISKNKLKFDSLFMVQYNRTRNSNHFTIDMRSVSASKFPFLIIQNHEGSQFYEWVAMTFLTYKSPVIEYWKLSNETKVINSIPCKKAEVHYKGRDWTAWYSTEIPFPYGPYKFSGLPGLIVKIIDQTGDYNFELVKSYPVLS